MGVEFCQNLAKTIAKEPGNHGSSQQCCDSSDIDVKQTPVDMCVRTNFVYNIPRCVYYVHTHNHMLITSGFASSLQGTNRDAF